MTRKVISVSKNRQITLPLPFFNHLKMGTQVECSLEDGAIVIRPLYKEPGEFSAEILKDLVAKGYSGDELIKRFELESKNVKKAIANMRKEADAITAGEKEAADMEQIFGSNN